RAPVPAAQDRLGIHGLAEGEGQDVTGLGLPRGGPVVHRLHVRRRRRGVVHGDRPRGRGAVPGPVGSDDREGLGPRRRGVGGGELGAAVAVGHAVDDEGPGGEHGGGGGGREGADGGGHGRDPGRRIAGVGGVGVHVVGAALVDGAGPAAGGLLDHGGRGGGGGGVDGHRVAGRSRGARPGADHDLDRVRPPPGGDRRLDAGGRGQGGGGRAGRR